MRIALAQVPCALGDKEENLDRMRKCLDAVTADLYVFPELFLTGYMVRDNIHRLAENIDGKSVQAARRLAKDRGASILFGMAVRDEERSGKLCNSAVLVSPDELVQRYDKENLATFGPFEEGLYFGAGTAGSVLEVDGHRIGVVICYDLFFPELSKRYALQGAEAIICMAASPVTSCRYFETILPARAVENTVYAVYVNQVGAQLNEVFFGGGEARGPRGELLVKNKYFEEDVNCFDLALEPLRSARIGRPTLRDTAFSLFP